MMKEYPMEPAAVEQLLHRAPAGRVSTNGEDGYPYTVAVHFLYQGGAIYFHGLPKGEKVGNLARDPRVCFEVDEMSGLRAEGVANPCQVGTNYQSVVARGRAILLTDPAEKEAVQKAFVDKYTPQYRELPLPPQMVEGTAVVQIGVESLTGKYRR